MNGANIAIETSGSTKMLHDVSKPIPQPTERLNGKLYDESGHTLHPQKEAGRLMATLNKEVKTTTGTLALIGLVPAFLAILITIGLNAMGWARDDGASKERLVQVNATIEAINKSQERIEGKLDKFDERLREQERFQDKTSSYKLGKEDK